MLPKLLGHILTSARLSVNADGPPTVQQALNANHFDAAIAEFTAALGSYDSDIDEDADEDADEEEADEEEEENENKDN
ncbi:hypothetical protein BD410DRAFT_846314 [Rickenella mellea]|uniref:Uncharacterized protein n=1 Tax=Rickenella mellea TaxID=50990 RepID=A0A4Y7PGH7_9AGAM|nr:hypothetical protein BD410DRAFT_846314 [Rickenella mellea]